MRKVHKYNFGDYHQKLVMDGKKLKDVECDCKWSTINKKAYKEGNTLCHHVKSAILKREMEMKNAK